MIPVRVASRSLASAHALGAPVNGLDPTAFPSLLALENAVVDGASALPRGDPDGVESVVGNVSGGTPQPSSLDMAADGRERAGAAAHRCCGIGAPFTPDRTDASMPVSERALIGRGDAVVQFGR
jgi:hypothetical protein